MTTTLERRRDERGLQPAAAAASGSGDAALRQAAGGFLDAADRAIDRALSGDSEGFLRGNRQQGGQ